MMARLMLMEMRMTNIDFTVHGKSGAHRPWFKPAELRLRAVDGVWILAFLATVAGLVFLLSN